MKTMYVINFIISLDAVIPLLSVDEWVYQPVITLTSLRISSALSQYSQRKDSRNISRSQILVLQDFSYAFLTFKGVYNFTSLSYPTIHVLYYKENFHVN